MPNSTLADTPAPVTRDTLDAFTPAEVRRLAELVAMFAGLRTHVSRMPKASDAEAVVFMRDAELLDGLYCAIAEYEASVPPVPHVGPPHVVAATLAAELHGS